MAKGKEQLPDRVIEMKQFDPKKIEAYDKDTPHDIVNTTIYHVHNEFGEIYNWTTKQWVKGYE